MLCLLPVRNACLPPELHHLRVDRCDVMVTGDGYPVVAIEDKVHVPYLPKLYRRKALSSMVSGVYTFPLRGQGLPAGQERWVEVPVTPYTSYYLFDLDRAHPPVRLAPPRQGGLRLVEGEQPIGAGTFAQP